jgi:hypothetical protein
MKTLTNKKQDAPAGTGAPSGNESTYKQNDYTALEWFSKQGARFVRVAAWNAKVNAPGKQPIEKDWQNKPLTLKDVLPHIKSGGNVGMICGKHSGGLVFVDVDENLSGFMETFPHYANYPRVVRDNPNKAKFILRLPSGVEYKWEKKYKKTPQDKHPFIEALCTGNQGVIPPSRHPSGEMYRLENSDKPIPEIEENILHNEMLLWADITRSPVPHSDYPHEPQKREYASRENGDDLRARVVSAWTPLKVFEHFGMTANGTRQEGEWIRVMGNGGLFAHENNLTWALPGSGKGSGGDVFDAWRYVSTQGKDMKLPHKDFYKTLCAMATAAGIPIESRKTSRKPAALDLVGDDIDEGDPRESFQVKRYEVIRGAYHAIEYKENKGAEPIIVARALCNFDARILEEIAKDDGQEVTRVLKINGQIATGARLPEIEVDAAEFKSMNWVMQYWGVKPIIYAGQSNGEKLREAMQWLSEDVVSRTEYTHTGWREIDGKRVYLTTTGAIGLDNVTVRLEGGLKRYAIPTSLEDVNIQEAVKKSLRLLDLAPRSVTWALWGCMYLAPLADISPIDFMLWLFAESGSLKSTLAAIFLSHYGNFTYKTLPEGWASTDNALEKSIFATKDAPIVIDDFAPQASGMEAQKYENRANRIIRAIGNHSPRTRMNADTSLREGYPSRGLVISTAEQLPSGQSILARTLPVEVLRDSVNIDLLTTAQREADYLPQAMTGYLIWLAENWELIKADFQERITNLRNEMRGDYHLRTPEMFANLLLGIQQGLTFANQTGAISKTEARTLFVNAKAEIKSLAESQSEHVRDELPTQRFINVLEALIAQGEFYLKDMDENAEGAGKTWLGWFDNDYVYIQSETAYNAVSEFLRREGGAPLLKQKGLYSMLSRYELIMPAEDRTTATAFYKGRTYRVLRFYKNKVHFTKEKTDVKPTASGEVV